MAGTCVKLHQQRDDSDYVVTTNALVIGTENVKQHEIVEEQQEREWGAGNNPPQYTAATDTVTNDLWTPNILTTWGHSTRAGPSPSQLQTFTLEELERHFKSDCTEGLTSTEAQRRLPLVGPNSISLRYVPTLVPWPCRLIQHIFFGRSTTCFFWMGSIICFVAYSVDDSKPINVEYSFCPKSIRFGVC